MIPSLKAMKLCLFVPLTHNAFLNCHKLSRNKMVKAKTTVVFPLKTGFNENMNII